MSVKGSCSICLNPKKRLFVDRLLAQGLTGFGVEKRSRTPEYKELGIGLSINYETVNRHKLKCLLGKESRPVRRELLVQTPEQRAVEAQVRVSAGMGDVNDIALLVRDRVAEKLKNDELRLTTQHGLSAQQMLDRREEKKADRELAMGIARMLAMTSPPKRVMPSPPVVVIEGDYRERT